MMMSFMQTIGKLYILFFSTEGLILPGYYPDWLISPPPSNPYLVKEEFVTKHKFIDKGLFKLHELTSSSKVVEFEEFKNLISSNDGESIKSARAAVKLKQIELDRANKSDLKKS